MSLIGALAALLLASGANSGETPAKPKDRDPPAYPAACTAPAGQEAGPQTVTVVFAVNADGLTESIRVRESSDPCFNEAAIGAVRRWLYEPRRVNGKPQLQEDLEVTLTFVIEETTGMVDFDARPIKRVPPTYPENCMMRAKPEEWVIVEFDVTAEGQPTNVRTIEATNKCFSKTAERTVAKWEYLPKTISGVPMPRYGVQSRITFLLAEEGSAPRPEHQMRDFILRRLNRIEKQAQRDPQGALVALAEFEEEYGDTLSRVELSAFHQVRATTRLAVGDYRGGLDDLRALRELGGPPDTLNSVNELIRVLEAQLEGEGAVTYEPINDGSDDDGDDDGSTDD